MNVGSVTLPVSLDITQLAGQARKASAAVSSNLSNVDFDFRNLSKLSSDVSEAIKWGLYEVNAGPLSTNVSNSLSKTLSGLNLNFSNVPQLASNVSTAVQWKLYGLDLGPLSKNVSNSFAGAISGINLNALNVAPLAANINKGVTGAVGSINLSPIASQVTGAFNQGVSAVNPANINLGPLSSQVTGAFNAGLSGISLNNLTTQAKKASDYLKGLNLPIAKDLRNQIDSAIGNFESIKKVAADFIGMQANLSAQTAKSTGQQAASFLSLQNVMGGVGNYAKGFFKGFSGSFTSFHTPVLAAIGGLGASFASMVPVIGGVILPLMGLGGALQGVAGAFFGAQMQALDFTSRGLVKQVKLIRELLPVTSSLRTVLSQISLPVDVFKSFDGVANAIVNAKNQVVAFKAQVDALTFNLVNNATGLLGGAGAFTAAGAPVGNPIAAAFDANKGVAEYIKFEQSMVMFESLAKSSGASAGDIKAVVEESKRLGAATSKSAVEASVLAGGLTRLGFNAKQVSESMAGVVATSEATAEPLEAVGRIIASTINQFQLSAADAGKVGDLLGIMANSTATSIIDMGEAMKYVGGSAKLANQSLDDTAIAIGVLANAGLNGGMAGTALNAALTSLQKAAGSAKSELDILNGSMKLTAEEMASLSVLTPTGSGGEFATPEAGSGLKGKALAELGLSKEDLLDSTGNLKSMLDIIPQIKAGVEELSKTSEGTAKVPILLDALFGEQGGRAVKALMSSTQESLNALKATAADASGFSSDVSEQMLSGISGTLTKLVSASQGISLVVGEFFAPMIQRLAKQVLGLMNAFLGLSPAVQKLALVGSIVVPILTVYWRGLTLLTYSKRALAATTKVLILLQTEEGRSKIQNTLLTAALEVKERALTAAKAAQAIAIKVQTGQMSVLAAAQLGLTKTLIVMKAGYKEWFSTVTNNINQIALQAKGIGQLGLFITSLGAKQNALSASTAMSTAMMAKQGIVAKGVSIVKIILAAITGKLAVANLGLAGTYAVLASRLVIIYAAFKTLQAVWNAATAGMAEASKLKKAADNIDKITASSKILGKETKDNEGIFGRFFNSLSDGEGPITAIQKAFGMATNANVAFRREMQATEVVAKSTNAQFDEGMAILNKYGVAQLEQGDKARLGAEGIKAFVDEASDQVRKINETISELQKQTPVNEEAKQALQVQIGLLTRQSSILQNRIQLIQSDTDLSKENAEAQAAVVISLESLTKKYQQLEKAQGFSDKTEALKIEEALAAGSIDAAKAAEDREEAESQAIQSRIDLNAKALDELKKSSEFVPTDERAKLEEEIANRTVAAVDLRIDAAKKEVEERERANAKLMESERAKFAALEAEASLSKTQQIQAVKTDQASGGISSGEAQSQISQINTQSIENAIALEQKRLEVERSLAQKGLLTRQEFLEKQREAEQKVADLSVDLLDAQVDAAQKANESILKSFEDRISAQEAALGLSNNAQIAQIRQSQLDGTLTQEDAELKLQGIRQQSVEQEKAIAQDKLATIQSLVAQGVITQEDAAKQTASAEKELSDLVISGLDEQLAARDKLKETRLNDIAEIASREAANAGLSSQLEINAIKQAQADKLITVEQSERQINELKAQGLAEEVDRQSQQLAQIAQLRDEGLLTEQEYGDKRIELERSIADVSSQIIESQIQEQQKLAQERLSVLEAELKRSETLQDIANNNRTASLKEALNAGAISEAEFSKQSAQLKVSEANQAIASEQRKLAQVSQLLSEGLITAKEAAERRLGIEKGISEKEINLIDAKEAARKAAADAAIKSMEDVAARQVDLAEKTSLKDELAIKSSGGSEDDISAQLAESSKRATEAAISAAKQQMAEVSRLQARGLLSAKEAADRRLALEKEVLQGTISLVDQRIAAEKKATEEILKQYEKRITAQKDSIELEKLRGEVAIAQGGGTDESKESARAALAEKAAQDSLALAQHQLAEIDKLQQRGALSAEEAASRRVELEKEVFQSQLGLIQQREAAEKRLTDNLLKEYETRISGQKSAIEVGKLKGELSTLQGGGTDDQIAAKMEAINKKAAESSIKLAQQQLREVSRLQAQGLITAEEAAQRRMELEKDVISGQIGLLQTQRAAEKKLTEDILKEYDKRREGSESTLKAGITQIKARELAGSLSAEEASNEIAQIEMDAQRQELSNLQGHLAQIASLRSQGVLTAEQAAERENELNKQIADANISLIEKQIDAKKRAADEAVAAIDKTLSAARRSLELGSSRSDMTSNRLGAYGANVDATANLMGATNNLENQRLEFQIKLAEAKEDELLVEQLKAEQFRNQFEQLQQTQEVQQNQLMLSQRQKEIEMEREQIQAKIALLEAQAEFAKAKASGASAEELAYLKEMVNLRDEALNWTQEAIAGQSELNRLEEESLRVQQQAEKEAAAQQRVLELQGKSLEDQGAARGIINKELKEAQKLQQGLEKGFQTPADATYVGFDSLSDNLKGAKVGQIARPDMGTKPQNNISGDIIGANTITINVTSEGNNAPVDIKQAVMSAMGDVTTQLKSRLGS